MSQHRQSYDPKHDRRPESTEQVEHLWVVLDLLDRQIVDDHLQAVGKVDDVDFAGAGVGSPRLSALLSGAQALGERIGGLVGHAMAGTARRLLTDPRGGARAVPWSDIAELGYVMKLRAGIAELELEPALEVWVRDNIIGPLPGSGHAGSWAVGPAGPGP